jgi:anti-sigma regulatory factor (Ser/Thr protein kinase)
VGAGYRFHVRPVSEPPRSRTTELRAGPETPAGARAFVSEALDILDADVDRDAALLLTSEVASNAARHGKGPIGVTVSVEEPDLRVSILDRGGGFDPKVLSSELRPDGGWGLRIVQDLASAWGVDRRDDGTEVWFRL